MKTELYMSEHDFAKEVHRRLCAMDESEAVKDPVGHLFRLGRQVAIVHPIKFFRFLWWRHQRRSGKR
jgi:hypothetical protein